MRAPIFSRGSPTGDVWSDIVKLPVAHARTPPFQFHVTFNYVISGEKIPLGHTPTVPREPLRVMWRLMTTIVRKKRGNRLRMRYFWSRDIISGKTFLLLLKCDFGCPYLLLTKDVEIWMEIPNYSVSSYLNLIPIRVFCMNCVNLIEIRFDAYIYAPYFLVLWHIIFEITAQIPEVEFGGKYGYLRANVNMFEFIPVNISTPTSSYY
jgi:hypothetical protein